MRAARGTWRAGINEWTVFLSLSVSIRESGYNFLVVCSCLIKVLIDVVHQRELGAPPPSPAPPKVGYPREFRIFAESLAEEAEHCIIGEPRGRGPQIFPTGTVPEKCARFLCQVGCKILVDGGCSDSLR